MIKENLTDRYKSCLAQFGLADVDCSNIYLIRFKKGEYLCCEGLPILYLFVLLEGKAEVFVTSKGGKTLLLSFCSANSILGEVELLTDGVATTSVKAMTDVLCIAIPLEDYKTRLNSSIAFMNYLSKELALKLTQSTKNCSANILYSLEARLCAYISMTAEDNIFNQKLTEVADLLGTSYRHLLRTLEKLCSKKILKRSAHGYMIKDNAELKLISSSFERFFL